MKLSNNSRGFVGIAILFAIVLMVILIGIFLSQSDVDPSEDDVITGSSNYDFVDSDAEFTAPSSWKTALNEKLGISLKTPSSWNGSNLSGPRNPIDEDNPVNQYQLFTGSSVQESTDGTVAEVRVSSPNNLYSCTPLHIEPITLSLNIAPLNMLFCESEESAGKVKFILLSNSEHELGETYTNIGFDLNGTLSDVRISFSNQDDQESNSKTKVYRDFTLAELNAREDLKTAIDVVRSISLAN